LRNQKFGLLFFSRGQKNRSKLTLIDRLRVGLIGCGGVSRVHIESYQALPDCFSLEAVCDVDEQKATSMAASYGLPQHYTEIEPLLSRQDLDIIDICTPPYQHYTQIRRALAAGKHVICEKPLVGSLAEIDALAQAEKEAHRRLMPILQYRFGQGIQKLKLLVEEGVAGRLYLSTVEVAWRRGADYYAVPWRGKWVTELGGTLLSHAIHALDMLCFIAGPVRSVFARTATLINPIEVEDCASVSFGMADGSLASFSVTLGSTPEITRHRFCFSGLTAESNTRPYTSSDDPWTFCGSSPQTDQQIAETLARFVSRPGSFDGQFTAFHSAISSGGELPVTLKDARNLMEILTAIYASAQSGQEVKLPLPADHPMYAGWMPH
jgi:predicted dehydrogenase